MNACSSRLYQLCVYCVGGTAGFTLGITRKPPSLVDWIGLDWIGLDWIGLDSPPPPHPQIAWGTGVSPRIARSRSAALVMHASSVLTIEIVDITAHNLGRLKFKRH